MPSYVRGREKGRALSDTQIVQAYVSGETAESIAQQACCCGVTVLQIIRRAGVPVRKPGSPPKHKQRTISDGEIIRRYREGQPGPRIADAANCTPGTVYRILRQYDVEIRPPVRPRRRKERVDG